MELRIEQIWECPLCGSREVEGEKVVPLSTPPDYLHYKICKGCGVWYLNPRMADDVVKQYYQGQYRALIYSNLIQQQNDLKMQMHRAKVQSAIIMHHCNSGAPSSHLEIGCSAGYLLEWMEEAGVQKSVGVEPDETYYMQYPAMKYHIFHDISDVPPEPYDLISLSHVVEHFNHPVQYLTNLFQNYAHRGTLVMVEVPDRVIPRNALIFHHPVSYDDKTLRFLLEKVGCEVHAIYAHGDQKEYLVAIAVVKKETK